MGLAMPETDTLVDIATLVGMESEQPCEEDGHEGDSEIHDGGPATHYLQIFHACYGDLGMIEAVCTGAANFVTQNRDLEYTCGDCLERRQLSYWTKVLGLIKELS